MLRVCVGVRFLGVCMLVLAISQSEAGAQGLTAEEALNTARRTGRPLLAIATSPTCGPCHALKSVVHGDDSLRPLLDDFVYLEMDSKSPDFAEFRSRFIGNFSGVPMVYMLRADGELMYGQSGSLNSEQLQLLLGHGVKNSGHILRADQLATVEAAYEKARLSATSGDLVKAMKSVSKIANIDSYAEVIEDAKATQTELGELIGDWMQRIDERIAAGKSIHANAYRLAELYVELPKSADVLRSNTLRLLEYYEKNDPTRTAIKQNKRLVRARLEEQRNMCEAAIASYRFVRDLEPGSPAGEFADERIQIVMARRQDKLTANMGASNASGATATAVP